MLEKLGILASGEEVYDRSRSHLHPGVVSLLPEALAQVNATGREFLVEECAFGRLVGQTTCVATHPGDEVVFAQRVGRFGLSRFVKGRTAEPCQAVTLILKKDRWDDYFVLIAAWVGHPAAPEPWDRNANGESQAFWGSHALVWASEPVVPGTEQLECPW